MTTEVCNGTGEFNQLDPLFDEIAFYTGGDLYITDDTAGVSLKLTFKYF